MARVSCYVDGFNLYHALALLEQPRLKWLNLKAVAESFLQKDDELVAVYYFTAIHTFDQQKCQRHNRYIDALRAVGVQVVISKFQRVDKYCRRQETNCPFLEEKQTDVAFATSLLVDAMDNLMDRAIIVTADSDHIPVVKLVTDRRPNIELVLAAPPGRMAQARDLGDYIAKRKELTPGRLSRCVLARTVYRLDGRVAATCPAAYLVGDEVAPEVTA